jgi:hypothetical protein
VQGGLRGAHGWLAPTLLLPDGREEVLTTANRLLPAAIAALAFAGAAPRRRPIATLLVRASKSLGASHPFAGTKSGVRRCVQVRSIGGGRRGHATRSRRRPDRLLRENDEQSRVYGRGAEGNNRGEGSQTTRVSARQWQPKSGSSYARRREGRLSGCPFVLACGRRAVEALFACTKTAAPLSKRTANRVAITAERDGPVARTP